MALSAGALAGIIAAVTCLPSSDEYQAGNCFLHHKALIYARVDRVWSRDKQIDYKFVDLEGREGEVSDKSRPNDSSEEGFRTIYPYKVPCGRVEDARLSVELNRVYTRLEKLEAKRK